MYARSGVIVGVSMLLLANAALASTGMSGVDGLFGTVDSSIGSIGYMFISVLLLGMVGAFWTGHTFIALGMFLAIMLVGGFIGHRAELAGLVNLSLGAEVGPQMPVELLP